MASTYSILNENKNKNFFKVQGIAWCLILHYLHSVMKVSQEELQEAERAIGEFGGDNRAGIEGTLHRISAIRSRKGTVVGLTCRVGRAVTGHVDMVRDLLEYKESILFLGRYVTVINLYHLKKHS